MVKRMNCASYAEERIKRTESAEVMLFGGSAQDNLKSNTFTPIRVNVGGALKDGMVVVSKEKWVNSEAYFKLWNDIGQLQKKIAGQVNAAQAPSASELATLQALVMLDLTKRAMQTGDMTDLIATEVTNFEFPELVSTKSLLPYRGQFRTISGANDSVPLVEQHTGDVDSVTLYIKGLGWITTLKNLVYNTLHDLQKVNEAVAAAYEDMRNAGTIGRIVGATYVTSQQQAADTTSGASFDFHMYETWRKAVAKIRGLKDFRTGLKIGVQTLSILCNSADAWNIDRAIRGQLTVGGATGTFTTQNMQGLPIANIIEYDGGNNNGFVIGKETISVPGVTAGKAYLFVPREYFWVAKKRPLTLETGVGNVLQLSQEARAWYAIQGEYDKVFLGSSYSGTSLGASFGSVLEVTLPTS